MNLKSKYYLAIIFVISISSNSIAKRTYSKMKKNEIKNKLTDLQYEVTMNNGTEKAFNNEYWNNKREGIYVDITTGQPIFSSNDKYDSKSGWPSFHRPIDKKVIVEKSDNSWISSRTEVRSKTGDIHLGHVFNDGPSDTGLRYCINSASLKFIPKEELEKNGLKEYISIFSTEEDFATFAGGCFWGLEHLYSKLDGVINVESGYEGGKTINPSYQDISTGKTGHAEVVRVTFNPKKISYETLVEYFFRLHDPTQLNKQGVDVGTQYRSQIFFNSNKQEKIALKVKELWQNSKIFKGKIVTKISKEEHFYKAEDYHQDYYKNKFKKFGEGQICHVLRPSRK